MYNKIPLAWKEMKHKRKKTTSRKRLFCEIAILNNYNMKS